MSFKSRFHALSLRSSVLIFVMVAAVGASVLVALGLRNNHRSEEISNHLLADMQLQRAALLVDMVHDGLLATTRAALLAGVFAPETERAAVRQELDDHARRLAEALALVAAGAADPGVRQSGVELKQQVEAYAGRAAALVEAALTGKPDPAPLREALESDFHALQQVLDRFGELVENQAHARLKQRDALFDSQRWWLLGAGGTMVAVLLGAGLQFSRGLLVRLGAEPPQLRQFARQIAEGALDTRFPGAQPPAGSVAAALLTMRDNLAATVTAIRHGADGVAAGSAQIASGNLDLAERTSHQTTSLQQVAGGMAEVTGSVGQTANHAQAATALAAESSAVASRGGEAVRRVMATMAGIDASSRRIADITNLIDDIAAQTNILAINAAVAASRAGEHGQGFAVVAAEVRRLAQRSAGAAQEIKSLIQGSLAQVTDGSRQVADAGATMGEIVAQVGRVNALIAAISGAARAQTEGIARVGASVSALDRGTQQNAALVERSADAAAMLRDRARHLADAVAVFRLGNEA